MKQKLQKILADFWDDAQNHPGEGYLAGEPVGKICSLFLKEYEKRKENIPLHANGFAGDVVALRNVDEVIYKMLKTK